MRYKAVGQAGGRRAVCIETAPDQRLACHLVPSLVWPQHPVLWECTPPSGIPSLWFLPSTPEPREGLHPTCRTPWCRSLLRVSPTPAARLLGHLQSSGRPSAGSPAVGGPAAPTGPALPSQLPTEGWGLVGQPWGPKQAASSLLGTGFSCWWYLGLWPGPTSGDTVQAALQGGMPGGGWAGTCRSRVLTGMGLTMCQVRLHKHSLVTSISADLRDTGQGRMWQGGRAGHEVASEPMQGFNIGFLREISNFC